MNRRSFDLIRRSLSDRFGIWPHDVSFYHAGQRTCFRGLARAARRAPTPPVLSLQEDQSPIEGLGSPKGLAQVPGRDVADERDHNGSECGGKAESTKTYRKLGNLCEHRSGAAQKLPAKRSTMLKLEPELN